MQKKIRNLYKPIDKRHAIFVRYKEYGKTLYGIEEIKERHAPDYVYRFGRLVSAIYEKNGKLFFHIFGKKHGNAKSFSKHLQNIPVDASNLNMESLPILYVDDNGKLLVAGDGYVVRDFIVGGL